MVSKATYGEQIWEELGDNMSHWNLDAMDILNETMFGFWPVDIFPSCEYLNGSLQAQGSNTLTDSAICSRLDPWITLQVR
jgi:hypothetical protein